MSQIENGQTGNQPLSIFDVQPDNVASFAQPTKAAGPEFFNPKPQDSPKDKVYRAVIRVLPNLADPAVPISIVRYYWFATGHNQGFRYNSPSSPNPHPENPENLMKPYGWCPISAFYWDLINTKDAQQEALAKREFSMQSQYTCLVQIKADSVHPENVGKVLPYRLPAALYKRMLSSMKPTDEDIQMGAQPMDMFHPVKGHDILLKITLKDVNGVEMRDYETSTISPNVSSMLLADGTLVDQAKYDTDPAYKQQIMQQIVDMLKEYPNVEKEWGYHEASDDIKRQVKMRLANYKDVSDIWPDIVINPSAAQQAQTTQPAPATAPAAAPATAPAAQTAIDPFAAASAPAAEPAPAAAPAAAPTTATMDAETEAFINGLK